MTADVGAEVVGKDFDAIAAQLNAITNARRTLMHSTKVKRLELIAKIQSNREEHRAIFLKAQDGYRALAIEELDRMLAEARSGKRIRRAVELIEPQDHTKEYDRVLAMLNMSVDEVIEVDAEQFAQYVLDEWSWKMGFVGSTSRYTG